MSTNMVSANRVTEATKKEINMWMGKYLEHLKSIDTDARVVKDDYGDIVDFIPRIHIRFKDNSDILYELTTGKPCNATVH